MAGELTVGGELAEFDATEGWLRVNPPGAVTRASATNSQAMLYARRVGSVFRYDDQFGAYRMSSIGFASS